MAVLNSKNGYPIWETTGRLDDVFLANFIPDQDNDTFPDILSSHSQYNENNGHLILISGKTGNELKRREIGRTYFMPQTFKRKDQLFLVYGTGGPASGGSLHLAPLSAIINSGNLTSTILYADPYSGMLTQSILVDITGDNQVDIIIAMYNSTVIAIDGSTLQQIWNHSIPNSETLMVPTPAYFNNDNITDFLIVYQVKNSENGTTTQTCILNGKTGKPIYENPFPGVLKDQAGSLSLRMSGYGNDMFSFWSNEAVCYFPNNDSNTTNYVFRTCSKTVNVTVVIKLNVMNQYDQPPGFEIYNSENRKYFELNNTKSALEEAVEFLRKHPEHINTGVQGRRNEESYERPVQIKHTYKSGPSPSNFRKTYNRNGLPLEYGANSERSKFNTGQRRPNIYEDYNQGREDVSTLVDENIDPIDLDYNNYDDSSAYSQNKKTLVDDTRSHKLKLRDPRSKEDVNEYLSDYIDIFTTELPLTPDYKNTLQKESLNNGSRYGIYDYQNVRNAKTRLLHDLDNVPTDILRETYFKNQDSQIKSRFKERDLQSREESMIDTEELPRSENENKEADSVNSSLNLWVLESEKEIEDKRDRYVRSKRDLSDGIVFNRIPSTGALTKSGDDTVEIIFYTYWTRSKGSNEQILDDYLQKCVSDKLEKQQGRLYDKTLIEEQAGVFMRECDDEYKAFQKGMPYYNQIFNLRLGQMVVYKLRIKCECQAVKRSEECAIFRPTENEGWTSYLNRNGDGVFH